MTTQFWIGERNQSGINSGADWMSSFTIGDARTAFRSATVGNHGCGFELPDVSLCSAKAQPVTESVTYTSDSSGKVDEHGKPVELKEKREHESWKADLSIADGKGSSAFSLNGKPVESWKFKFQENKVVELDMQLHPDPQPDNEGLKDARRALAAAVHKSEMSPAAKLEFFKDMAHVEHRARQGEMGRDPSQVRKELAETYKQTERLFTDKDSAVPLNERIVLARQLAHQLADTMDIDQGMVSDGCRISVVECRLSVRRPSVVARVVADAVLSGQVAFGKTVIKLDKESLQPASSFATQIPRGQNERSYASQLFQLVGMNLIGTDADAVREHVHFMNLDEKQPRTPQYDRLVFRQTKEGPRAEKDEEFPNGAKIKKGELLKRDNGMQVYGQKDDKLELLTKPGVLREGTNQPLLQAYQSQRLLDMIDPDKHAGVVLAHRDVVYYTRDNFKNDGQSDSRGLVLFSKPEELEAIVAKAAAEDNLPLIAATRTSDPDPGELPPKMEPDESNHVLTIRNYVRTHSAMDPDRLSKNKLVTDDQFGRDYDHRNSSIVDLFKKMQPGKAR